MRAQIQRKSDVIHVIARRLNDMSALLPSVGGGTNVADVAGVYCGHRADVVKRGMKPDSRSIHIPDLRPVSSIVPSEPIE